MRKHVYLFELDSVRKTDTEIAIGQKAIYDEIVGNGNIVVLTFNQLIDSRGFFSLLADNDYYDSLISLFELGAIKISQFDDIRTVTQYLLRSFDFNKEFIFSGWPLKSTQKNLLALIKRSLIYSDLSEIEEYLGDDAAEKRNELFKERIKNDTDEDGVARYTFVDSKITDENKETILTNILAMVKMSLRLSPMTQIYVKPRLQDNYKQEKMTDLLATVLTYEAPEEQELWNKAVSIIKGLDATKRKLNNRSAYHKELFELAAREDAPYERQAYQYAEAAVDQLYNYACEISILNTSKHYTGCGDDSFRTDFFSRLSGNWNTRSDDRDQRYLLPETCEYTKFTSKKAVSAIAEIKDLVTYAKEEKPKTGDEKIYCYEHSLTNQQLKHRDTLLAAIGKKGLIAFGSIILVCFIEILFSVVQSALEDTIWYNTNMVFRYITETLIFLCIAESISTVLSKLFPKIFMSLSDALKNFFIQFKMAYHILKIKISSHLNKPLLTKADEGSAPEDPNIIAIKTDALRKYALAKSSFDPSLFADSEYIPLVHVDRNIPDDLVKQIRSNEDLNGCQYGIVYQSRYNTLVVDPVLRNGKMIPYERLLPTTGNGTVMIPVYKGKLIFVRQYRHAPRREQIAFPRGFLAPNTEPKENAIRELEQEIGATVTKEPVLIGRVIPDSGLTGGRIHIYMVEIDSYDASKTDKNETILQVLECTEDEVDRMLQGNMSGDMELFDDGFTMSAYLMYKQIKKTSV